MNNGKSRGCECHNDRNHEPNKFKTLIIVKHTHHNGNVKRAFKIDKSLRTEFLDDPAFDAVWESF